MHGSWSSNSCRSTHGLDNPSLFDETAILNLLNGDALNLKLTTTVTDGDGDTASSSATVTLIDGANSVSSFDDDGPTVSVNVHPPAKASWRRCSGIWRRPSAQDGS